MALGFPWLGIGGYGYIHRKFAARGLSTVKTDGMKKQVAAVSDDPNGIFPAQGAYKRYPLSGYIKYRFKRIDAYIASIPEKARRAKLWRSLRVWRKR